MLLMPLACLTSHPPRRRRESLQYVGVGVRFCSIGNMERCLTSRESSVSDFSDRTVGSVLEDYKLENVSSSRGEAITELL